MTTTLETFRLRQLPLPLRALLSLTLIVLGAGYGIAVFNLYLTYEMTDGQRGLTANDLRRAFYGRRDSTKIAAKIHGGSMQQFLPRPGDREKILSWIQDGAERDAYTRVVAPILAENCVRCHNPNGLQRFVPLTTYEEVMTVTQIDRGEPVQLWARVAHTHIQSLAMIFLVLGAVFCFTSFSDRVKTAVVVVAFGSLLADFGCRFLAKYWPDIVYVMMGAGALLGMSIAVLILASLHEMWLKKS